MPVYAYSLPPIDFAAVASSLGDLRRVVAEDLKHPGRAGKFPCPFHGEGQERTPSLHVEADHFHCFGCNKHGDALDWIAAREGLTLIEAAKRVDPSIVTAEDIDRLERGGPPAAPPGPRAAPAPAPPPPPETWKGPEYRRTLDDLVRRAEVILWSPEGRPALGWLKRRGLADVTIRRFRLGFLPADVRTDPVPGLLDDDGQTRGIYAPRGVTLPWLAPEAWYSDADGEPDGPRWVGMNVRRLADDVDGPLPEGVQKCFAAKGSRRGFLYPWPEILPTQGDGPLLLVEGEFDALIGVQAAGHLLNVATAGSASVRNLPRESRSALARCPWILLSLDHDGAGVGGARSWREQYPHKARRVLLPCGKDLNAFVLAGGDTAGWVMEILADLTEPGPTTRGRTADRECSGRPAVAPVGPDNTARGRNSVKQPSVDPEPGLLLPDDEQPAADPFTDSELLSSLLKVGFRPVDLGGPLAPAWISDERLSVPMRAVRESVEFEKTMGRAPIILKAKGSRPKARARG